MRVQEQNKLSGRLRLSAYSYPDILSGYRELLARVAKCKTSFYIIDSQNGRVHNPATVTSDNDTYVTVQHGRAVRVFTLVARRGDKPIPFGHLIELGRVRSAL